MSFFITFGKSLYRFDEYSNLIKISRLKTFLYTIILALILAINFIVIFIPIKNNFIDTVIDSCPDFKIENNVLKVDEVIDFTSYGQKLLIDTQNEHNIYDYTNFYTVLLIDSNSIITKSGDDIVELPISHLANKFNIYSKQDLIDSIPAFMKFLYKSFFFPITSIFLLICYIGLIIRLLLLSLIVKIVFIGKKDLHLSFKEVFRIAMLANTLPLLLTLLFNLLGLITPALVYFLIFLIIIILVRKNLNNSSLAE